MTKLTWFLSVLAIFVMTSCSENQAAYSIPSAKVPAGDASLILEKDAASPTSTLVADNTDVDAIAPAKTDAVSENLNSYTGHNAYGSEYPDFVIYYDPALWQLVLVDDNQRNDSLDSTQVLSCSLLLGMGPIGSPVIEQKQVGSYQWYITETNDPRSFLYWTQSDDSHSLFFGLTVPDTESTERNQQCMALAEQVMSTAAFVKAAEIPQSPTVSVNGEWAKYTHPEWGITITYPAAWKLSMPDFDKLAQLPAEGAPGGNIYNPDVEQMRMSGHVITLEVPGNAGTLATQVTIALEAFTLSPQADLQTWVELGHQLSALENPLADTTKVTTVDVANLSFAGSGDQVAYDILENELFHIETIWIAKNELIFSVRAYSADPSIIEQLHRIAATLEFNADKLVTIRANAQFAGDEQQIEESIANLQIQPTLECDIACRDQKALDEMTGQNNQGLEETNEEPSPLPTP